MAEKCTWCKKTVYAAERQVYEEKVFHMLCAGSFMESKKKAPVHNVSEEIFANKGDGHYQDREKQATGKK